jgi:hypothetical protein
MDTNPDPSEVSKEVVEVIMKNHKKLSDLWDKKYPLNKVVEPEEKDTDGKD